jgi:hypothetical protein
VLPVPPVSAALPRAAPSRWRSPPPLSCPGPPVSHVVSRRPRRPPVSRGNAPPTPPPPSPPLPFKIEPAPVGRIFLPRAPFVSSVHARAPHTCPPPPRRPPHRLPATGAPPPRRTPPERHRHPPPSSERPLSCSIPQSVAASSPHWSPSSCRTPPRASTTTRALSSPTPPTASTPTPPLHPLMSSRH